MKPRQEYPLDVSLLRKGQVIPVVELESILGVPATDRFWSVKLFRLKRRINVRRADLGLPLLTMSSDHGALVICDDKAASNLNRKKGKQCVRGYKRAAACNVCVDASQLDDESKKMHERTLLRQAMVLRAIKSVSHKAITNGMNSRITPPAITAK